MEERDLKEGLEGGDKGSLIDGWGIPGTDPRTWVPPRRTRDCIQRVRTVTGPMVSYVLDKDLVGALR